MARLFTEYQDEIDFQLKKVAEFTRNHQIVFVGFFNVAGQTKVFAHLRNLSTQRLFIYQHAIDYTVDFTTAQQQFQQHQTPHIMNDAAQLSELDSWHCIDLHGMLVECQVFNESEMESFISNYQLLFAGIDIGKSVVHTNEEYRSYIFGFTLKNAMQEVQRPFQTRVFFSDFYTYCIQNNLPLNDMNLMQCLLKSELFLQELSCAMDFTNIPQNLLPDYSNENLQAKRNKRK